MQGFFDGVDAFEGAAGCAEIGHTLDDGSFEPSLQLVQEAVLDLLVGYFNFIPFLFNAQ